MPDEHDTLPDTSAPDDRSLAADLIERFFVTHADLLTPVVEKALRIREMTDGIDPFIQSHTSVVCPLCKNVCCINRHGRYDYCDLIYLNGLGDAPSVTATAGADTDPCGFLTAWGCGITRSLRPFRCNWHFCMDLISSIEQGPAKPYREFIRRFQEIQRLRAEMAKEFDRARLLAGSVNAIPSQSA